MSVEETNQEQKANTRKYITAEPMDEVKHSHGIAFTAGELFNWERL